MFYNKGWHDEISYPWEKIKNVWMKYWDQRKDIFRILILEPNLDLFCMAMNYSDLRPLLLSEKVHLLVGDVEIDWDRFNAVINDKPFAKQCAICGTKRKKEPKAETPRNCSVYRVSALRLGHPIALIRMSCYNCVLVQHVFVN